MTDERYRTQAGGSHRLAKGAVGAVIVIAFGAPLAGAAGLDLPQAPSPVVAPQLPGGGAPAVPDLPVQEPQQPLVPELPQVDSTIAVPAVTTLPVPAEELDTVTQPVGQVVDGATDAVGGVVGGATGGAGDVGGVVDGATGGAGDVVGGVTDTVEEAVQDATGGAGDVVDEVTDAVDKATGGVGGVVDEVIGGGTGPVDEVAGEVTGGGGTVGGVVDEVTGGGGPVGGVVDGVTGGGGPVEEVVNTVNGVVNGVSGELGNNVGGVVGKVGDAVNDLTGASSVAPVEGSSGEPGIGTGIGGGSRMTDAPEEVAGVRTARELAASVSADGFVGSGAAAGLSVPTVTGPRSEVAAPSLIERIARSAADVAGRIAFPMLLALAVGAFVLVQNRIDRKDPKLAMAALDADEDLMGFE